MNPELRRNLWLEVTPHRLVLMPVLILAAAYVGQQVLGPLSLVGFVGLTVIWGARQSAMSIVEEARARTWDIQRMCALEPWAMTWGKLAGSTCLAWYGGALCLLLYFADGRYDVDGQRQLVAAFAVASALVLQGTAMMGALVSLRLGTRMGGRSGGLTFVVVVTLVLLKLLDLFDADSQVAWYGARWPALEFWTASAAAFAAWSIVGPYRAMCTELQVRTVPWLWPAFALFLAAWGLGFTGAPGAWPPRPVAGGASLAAFVAVVLTYVAAFLTVRDPVDYRRVARALVDGRLRRALEELPVWASSAVLAALAAAVCAAIGSDPLVENGRLDNLGPVALAMFLAMLRDLGLLGFFSFRPGAHRAGATTLVYLVALYGIVPQALELMNLDGVRQLVRPDLLERPWLAVAVFLVQSAVTVAMAVHAWRRAMHGPAAPGVPG